VNRASLPTASSPLPTNNAEVRSQTGLGQEEVVLEAPLSASSKSSGASGWTEAAGVVGVPFLRRRRLPVSGTIDGSGAVSGPEPDLDPSGALPPFVLEPGRSPCGVSRTTSSWFSPFWDSTSVSSVGRGEEAIGSEALFTSDESREPLDESPR